MTRKIINDREVDGATPISFIVGTFSDYRYKVGRQQCPCPPARARYGRGCHICKPARHIEAATVDQRLSRVLAHAANESVRASLGRGTSNPRDASTALWSAGLQGVDATVLNNLKVAMEGAKNV